MKAISYDKYGPPEVLEVRDVPRPDPAAGEILVRVTASAVTTADWRLRASAFPGGLWLPGRLMTGLFRPRRKVLGAAFAGDVAEIGAGVSEFLVGDPVFGFSGSGAHAEYLTMAASGAVHRAPRGLSPIEAASLPFGGLSALVFLRDYAKLKQGQRILIVGATGGVGAFAVQIAADIGADVTALGSTPHLELARQLGAEHVVDYLVDDVTAGGHHFDVVLDTVGALEVAGARAVLKPGGVFVPLNFGLKQIWQALWARLRGGPKIVIGVSGDTKEDLAALAGLVERGAVRPVVDRIFPLDKAREAHAAVERRHRAGVVVLSAA